MRLFTAIDLGDRARLAIAEAQRRVVASLGDPGGSLRLVRADHVHLTLVFLGEVDEAVAQSVVAAMSEPFSLAPFALSIGGAGVFPPRGAPRVLWLGVLDGTAEAIALQRLVVDRLAPFGIEREARPFRPHLTLARWRESRGAQRPRLSEHAAAIART